MNFYMIDTCCKNCKFCKELRLFKRQIYQEVKPEHTSISIQILPSEYDKTYLCTVVDEMSIEPSNVYISEVLENDCCEMFTPREGN